MGRNLDTVTRDQLAVRKTLGQKVPAVSNVAEEIYSPEEGIETVGIMVTVTNDSNQDRTATIYYDDNGTTYDKTTRVAQRTVTKGSESEKENLFVATNSSSSSLAVESSSGGDLTFTIWGIERPIK